jgi:hypothetical protein
LPSRLKSPTATDAGQSPAATLVGAAKLTAAAACAGTEVERRAGCQRPVRRDGSTACDFPRSCSWNCGRGSHAASPTHRRQSHSTEAITWSVVALSGHNDSVIKQSCRSTTAKTSLAKDWPLFTGLRGCGPSSSRHRGRA